MAEQTPDTAAIAAVAAVAAHRKAQADSEHKEQPNPIASFFVNIFHQLPLPNNQSKPKPTHSATPTPEPVIKATVEETKTTVVTFPKHDHELPSLKFEAEGADTNTNPVLLWQVYAIGGFFVLRWAWSRWNERKGKKKPSNEERSTEEPPNEDAPPHS